MLDLRRTNRAVSDWERGVHMPDPAQLERLAVALGVHWNDFNCVGHPETGGSEREGTL